MKANDLRIGNWVYESLYSLYPMQVVSITAECVYLDFDGNQGDVWEADIDRVLPIPLTEDILLKCGFKKQTSEYPADHEDYHEWLERDFPVIGWLCHSENKSHIHNEDETIKIYTLHHFQNLHHALTGEEMEIRL